MKSLLYASLAVFCFTQLFIGAVVGDIPVPLLGKLVPVGFGLFECVVTNGLAALKGAEQIGAQGGKIQAAAGATGNPLGNLPLNTLLQGIPVVGPILDGILGGLLNGGSGGLLSSLPLVGSILGGGGGGGGLLGGLLGGIPIVGGLLGGSSGSGGNLISGLPILGGLLNGLPLVGPLVGLVTDLVFGTVVGLVKGVLVTVAGVLYCIVGPNGLVFGVLDNLGNPVDGAVKDLPIGL